MAKRMQEGLKLYKQGKVEIDFLDNDLMIFKIKGSRDEIYQISMNNDAWLCDCDDYQWRSEKDPGSFLCKHIWAALFEIAEISLDE